MTITKKSDSIKVEGHRGRWYVIDNGTFSKDGSTVEMFLLEHETYGDEAACLIVDAECNLILDDVWNGLDDLEDDDWEQEEISN